MAAAPLIFAAASVGASGVAAYKSLTAKAPAAPAAPTLPDKPASTEAANRDVAKKRYQTLLFADQGARPSTLLAGGLPPAPTVRSTLLGM